MDHEWRKAWERSRHKPGRQKVWLCARCGGHGGDRRGRERPPPKWMARMLDELGRPRSQRMFPDCDEALAESVMRS